MNNKDKMTICESIARQLLTGKQIDKDLSEQLIKGLCEEYHEVRQRGIAGDGKGPVGEI